jgi:chromosome segregation ATPase
MDQDQMKKQVEWLDKERREDKKAIVALQKKVAELEGLLEKTNAALKESNSEITRLGVLVAKVDQFEEVMTEHRSAVKKEIDAQEKRAKQREATAKKSLSADLDKIRNDYAETSHQVQKLDKLGKQLTENQENDSRRDKTLSDVAQQLKVLEGKLGEAQNDLQIFQDDRASDQKRFTDLVGEVSALRTKLDELRGKHELLTEANRKTETRLNEVIAADDQRRANQLDYLEKLSLENEERDKNWRKWEKRFSSIETQAEAMDRSLESYSEAERAVQKAQKDLERITEQINRRIHEITEMQRLGEERFRQEWNTFKADDQKRWANYALTQDEQTKESSRRFERLSDRATSLEELTQDLRDTVQHTNEQFEKLMQGVLASMRDWLATTERYMDSVGK